LNPHNRQDDFILQVNPQLNVATQGRRANVVLDYQMQNLIFQDHAQYNDTKHQLATGLGTELVERTLFFDANAHYRQVALSGNQIDDPLRLTANNAETDLFTYTLTPRLRREVGSVAVFEAHYSRGNVHYSETTLQNNNATTDAVGAKISSGRQFRRWQWLVNYQHTQNNIEEANKVSPTLERTLAESKHKLTRKSMLILRGGYESNQYTSQSLQQENAGSEWGVGFDLTPSSRTLLHALIGERYFGQTQEVDLSHRTARSLYTLSYHEAVTTRNQLESQAVITLNQLPSSITNDVLLNKTLAFKTTHQFRKTNITFEITRLDSDNLNSGIGEQSDIYGTTWRWQLNRRSDVETKLKWIERALNSGSDYTDQATAEVSYIRKMQRQVEGRIFYAYLDQLSSTPLYDYHRNLVGIVVNITF
ncbi:MAG: hypothetical protein FD130_390, partial [Halothiobacillaceae bacterium]